MNEYVDVVEWLDSMGYACFDCECRARKELRATPMGVCPNTKLRPIGGAGAGAAASQLWFFHEGLSTPLYFQAAFGL